MVGERTKICVVCVLCVVIPFGISPPSFWGAFLNFSREKDSAVPFPRRQQSRILFTNELIVLHLLGIFLCSKFLFFCEEKSQSV